MRRPRVQRDPSTEGKRTSAPVRRPPRRPDASGRSSSARRAPVSTRSSAAASARTVSTCGRRRSPRSSALTAWTERPAMVASSSCVEAGCFRGRLQMRPKGSGSAHFQCRHLTVRGCARLTARLCLRLCDYCAGDVGGRSWGRHHTLDACDHGRNRRRLSPTPPDSSARSSWNCSWPAAMVFALTGSFEAAASVRRAGAVAIMGDVSTPGRWQGRRPRRTGCSTSLRGESTEVRLGPTDPQPSPVPSGGWTSTCSTPSPPARHGRVV